jgi:hypothetical protein
MDYTVEITQEGRGGWVYYLEDGVKLPFDWDFSAIGTDIYVPIPAEWDSFCNEHSSYAARGRRQEILERVAEEVRRKKAKTAKVTIDDTGISFSFEHDWLHRLLSKILGV